MKAYTIVSIAALLLVFATQAIAQSNSSKDELFVTKALQGGNKEIRLGQLASEKATASDVKAYGAMMVKDHQDANSELTGLAEQNDYQHVTGENKDAAKAFDKFSGYSGNDFDEAFMKEMVKDHEKVIALFEKEAKQGDDRSIRQWAKEKLPVLQQHLSQAKNILSNLKRTR